MCLSIKPEGQYVIASVAIFAPPTFEAAVGCIPFSLYKKYS